MCSKPQVNCWCCKLSSKGHAKGQVIQKLGSADTSAPFILTKSLVKHLQSACVSFKGSAKEGMINKRDKLAGSFIHIHACTLFT